MKQKLPTRQMIAVPSEHGIEKQSPNFKHGDRFHFHCVSSSKTSDAVDASSFHPRSDSIIFTSYGPNDANQLSGTHGSSTPRRANGFAIWSPKPN